MRKDHRVFEVLFTSNVDSAKLVSRTLHGEKYLVGPVVMAKEIVMNGLFYGDNDLKKSTPHWNQRPVVVGHPKNSNGANISANSPDTLEKYQAGFLFNTSYDEKETKLKSEIWLSINMLKTQKRLKEAIDAGKMLEVSTGLFLDKVSEEGEFDGRAYNAVAKNYKPDHLAILLDETGACSVEDGAGFPRANADQIQTMENESDVLFADNGTMGYSAQMAVLQRSLRKHYKDKDTQGMSPCPYIEDTFDNNVVYTLYDSLGYQYLRLNFEMAKDGLSVKFVGDAVPVVRKVTYEDAPSANEKGKQKMTRKEQVQKLIENKRFDETKRAFLEGLSDEDFAAINKACEVPVVPQTPPSVPENNGTSVKPITPSTVTPAANQEQVKDSEEIAYARELLANEKAACVDKILANSKEFTKDELMTTPLKTLKRMASLIKPAVNVDEGDFKGRGGPGGVNSSGNEPKLKTTALVS